MKRFAKNLILFALISTSIFKIEVSSATDSSDPRNFKEQNVMALGGSEFSAYKSSFSDFLMKTEKGARFLAESFPSGFPGTKSAFRDNNPVTQYKLWYAQNYGGGGKASQEELEKAQKALEEARVHHQDALVLARTHASGEIQALAKQVAIRDSQLGFTQRELIAKGGGFKDPQIQQFVEAVISRDEIDLSQAIFDDHSRTITVDTQVNSERFQITKAGVDPEDYEAFKRFAKFHEKIYTRAYNAASSALEDLITSTLKAAKPMPYHTVQATDLRKSIAGLEWYLSYHEKTGGDLQKWRALPFDRYLNINLLKPEAIEDLRARIGRSFQQIAGIIPPGDGGHPFGSLALHNFLDKVNASIALPTQVSFSKEEVADILRDIGVLLETDDTGGIIIDSVYFDKVAALVESFQSVIQSMEKDHKDVMDAEDARAISELKRAVLDGPEKVKQETQIENAWQAKNLMPRVQQAIAANQINAAEVIQFAELCVTLKQNTALTARGFQTVVKELAAATVDIPTLTYQDSSALTLCLKSGKLAATLKPYKAVLFLVSTFAPKQYEEVVKKTILCKDMKLSEVSALSAYYGENILAIQHLLSDFASEGFVWRTAEYDDMKKAEKVASMHSYLQSVMSGTPLTVNLSSLKERLLGVNKDVITRSNLILRACEFLVISDVTDRITKEKKKDEEDDERKKKADKQYTAPAREYRKTVDKKLTESKAVEVYDLMPVASAPLMNALQAFKIAGNNFDRNEDKMSLVGSYLSFNDGKDYAAKIDALGQFFTQVLPATAKNSDFVIAALSFPGIKLSYETRHADLLKSLAEYSQLKSTLEKLKAFANEKLKEKPDELTAASKHLNKLIRLLEIGEQFLEDKDASTAVTLSHGSTPKDTSFKVITGLPRLNFEGLCRCTDYYSTYYNAVKILHFLDLASLSDNDFAFLCDQIKDGLSHDHKARSDIDNVMARAQDLKENVKAFFDEIKRVMQFIENFKKLKDEYHNPRGEVVFDLYASIGALTPVSSVGLLGGHPPLSLVSGGQPQPPRMGTGAPPPPPPMTGAPPPPSGLGLIPTAVVASKLGRNAKTFANDRMLEQFNQKEFDIHKGLMGAKFNIQTAKPDEKEELYSKKIGAYLDMARALTEHLSHVDFTKVTVDNSVFLVRQVMTLVDLHLRSVVISELEKAGQVSQTMLQLIADTGEVATKGRTHANALELVERAREAKEAYKPYQAKYGELKEKYKLFRTEYLDILSRYKIETIMKVFSNPAVLTEDEDHIILKLLSNVNPALKAVISDAIIALFESIDFRAGTAKDVDVATAILQSVDTHLDLGNSAKRDAKGVLLPVVFDSIVQIKKIKKE